MTKLTDKALRNHLAELSEGAGDEIAAVVTHLDEHTYVCCESTVDLIKMLPDLLREHLALRKVARAAKALRNAAGDECIPADVYNGLCEALDAYEKRAKGKVT